MGWSGISEQARGRWLMIAAAVLWSTSGVFVKSSSELPAASIAMYRSLVAGASLCAMVYFSGTRISWRPMMIGMALCFATMNYFFITAMTLTTAANTIFLQYTAPFWMFLASVWLLKEPVNRGNLLALVGGMAGIGLLIVGEWSSGAEENRLGILYGLASGVTYAAVAVYLRVLRDDDALWLATVNHVAAGILLAGGIGLAIGLGFAPVSAMWPPPSPSRLAVLALFGIGQMALPYVLFGMGLRYVTPQEAGLLTLVEPLLNPFWTYLAMGERPSGAAMLGGGILIAMLLVRYVRHAQIRARISR